MSDGDGSGGDDGGAGNRGGGSGGGLTLEALGRALRWETFALLGALIVLALLFG